MALNKVGLWVVSMVEVKVNEGAVLMENLRGEFVVVEKVEMLAVSWEMNEVEH